MNICEAEKCTGCGACLNVCPTNSIVMVRDIHGFDCPQVDMSTCVQCNACYQACPQMHVQHFEKKLSLIYAGQLQNKDTVLENSSSGGVAYALSEYIIKRGGIVFGAVYGEDMRVTHVPVERVSDISYLQGSKYVQSYIGTSYRNVKESLRKGKEVLFVGVGCQVEGLYQFLGEKSYPGLVTCSLICGGGTSPGLFERYISYLERKIGKSILSYNFRDKQYLSGAYISSIISEDGHKLFLRGKEAGFVRTMGAGYIRKCCIECKFSGLDHIGDFSLGDYHDVNEYADRKGLSLVFVNSMKGKDILAQLKMNNIWSKQLTNYDIFSSNSYSLKRKKNLPEDYDAFFRDAFEKPWPQVYRKYLQASWGTELLDLVPVQLVPFLLSIKRSFQKNGR